MSEKNKKNNFFFDYWLDFVCIFVFFYLWIKNMLLWSVLISSIVIVLILIFVVYIFKYLVENFEKLTNYFIYDLWEQEQFKKGIDDEWTDYKNIWDKILRRSANWISKNKFFYYIINLIVLLIPNIFLKWWLMPLVLWYWYWIKGYLNGWKDIFFYKYFGWDSREFFNKVFYYYYKYVDWIPREFIRNPFLRLIFISNYIIANYFSYFILNLFFMLRIRFYLITYILIAYAFKVYPLSQYEWFTLKNVLILIYIYILIVWPVILYLSDIIKSRKLVFNWIDVPPVFRDYVYYTNFCILAINRCVFRNEWNFFIYYFFFNVADYKNVMYRHWKSGKMFYMWWIYNIELDYIEGFPFEVTSMYQKMYNVKYDRGYISNIVLSLWKHDLCLDYYIPLFFDYKELLEYYPLDLKNKKGILYKDVIQDYIINYECAKFDEIQKKILFYSLKKLVWFIMDVRSLYNNINIENMLLEKDPIKRCLNILKIDKGVLYIDFRDIFYDNEWEAELINRNTPIAYIINNGKSLRGGNYNSVFYSLIKNYDLKYIHDKDKELGKIFIDGSMDFVETQKEKEGYYQKQYMYSKECLLKMLNILNDPNNIKPIQCVKIPNTFRSLTKGYKLYKLGCETMLMSSKRKWIVLAHLNLCEEQLKQKKINYLKQVGYKLHYSFVDLKINLKELDNFQKLLNEFLLRMDVKVTQYTKEYLAFKSQVLESELVIDKFKDKLWENL